MIKAIDDQDVAQNVAMIEAESTYRAHIKRDAPHLPDWDALTDAEREMLWRMYAHGLFWGDVYSRVPADELLVLS